MSDLITRTARLVPYSKRPRQVPSFVTAYAYEPLADDPGAELGNLYVVLEALVSGRASEEVADLIIETVGDQYYNQEHEAADALGRFEAAIKATNAELGEHVNRGNAAWIGKLSAVIAVQAGSELHVAHTGSAEGVLYRGKSSTRIATGSNGRPVTPTKTFGSIASGHLESGDRLLLATPALMHQVPLTRLQSIIGQNGPNSAIAEITDLLKGAAVDRIAALIIEITTPELAALQVRSEQPSEIQLGSPENAIEAVKLVAEPIAQSTVASSRRVAGAARTGWHRAKPHARNAGLAAADLLRRALSTRGGRRLALIITAAVVALILLAITLHGLTQSSSRTFTKYQAAYNQYAQGQTLAASGHKSEARSDYTSAQHALESLKSSQHQIDAKLSHTALPEGEPRSYNELATAISHGLDQLDNLVHADPVTVASLTGKPDHFEIAGGKAYVLDPSKHNALTIVNLSTGAVTPSKADLSAAGDVIATTISGSGDGIYMLTNKPGVWFYRFATDTAAPQQVSYGGWPSAISIASYASNLYLLTADGTVYKQTRNATGFSPKIVYNSTTSDSAKPSSLAVDGSVYVAFADGLRLYVSGALKQTSPIPSELSAVTNLRTSTKDDLLVGTSASSKRVAVWSLGAAAPAFSEQIALSNVAALYDAQYDSATTSFYALVDGRLVRFSNPQ